MSQDEQHPISTSLRHAFEDIEDVLTLSEGQLGTTGSEGAALAQQIEDLSFELAMLVEEKL